MLQMILENACILRGKSDAKKQENGQKIKTHGDFSQGSSSIKMVIFESNQQAGKICSSLHSPI